MTNPTYYTRIEGEGQRKVAEILANDDKARPTFGPNGSPSMANSVPVLSHTRVQDTTGLVESQVCEQVFDIGFLRNGELVGSITWKTSANLVEIPFADFIQRFVPLEVVGLLAGYHGHQILSNDDTERACKVLETALETQQEVNSLVDTIQKAFIRKKGQQ